MKRIGKGLLAGFAIAALVGACAKEQTSFVDTPHPGTPAYWESQVPEPTSAKQKQAPAQATPAAGTYYPEWPALDGGVSTDPGPTSKNGGGTTDPYLWQEGSGTELVAPPPEVATEPGAPESQVPLRDPEAATESYTIVGDQAPVAGPPLRDTDDPYADLDATDGGTDAAAPRFATPPDQALPVPAKAIAVPGPLEPLPSPDGALP
jgi:hypothetical protein